MTMDTQLSQIFNMTPIKEALPLVVVPETLPSVIESSKSEEAGSADEDMEIVRDTLHGLLEKGNEALTDMLAVAKSTEHPRAFEVAGQLIKTIGDTAKELVKLQKSKAELAGNKKGEPVPVAPTQNTVIFAGSTSDLLREVRRANERVIENGE